MVATRARQTAAEPEDTGSGLINVLLAITAALIFLPFDVKLGPAVMAPFEFFAILCIGLIVWRGFRTPPMTAPLVILVVGYYAHLAISASFFDMTTTIKEAIQSAILFGFCFCAFGYFTERTFKQSFKIFLALCVCLMIYNAYWHISQGFYVGWKRLNEPKLIFVLLPTLMVIMAAVYGRSIPKLVWPLLIIATAVLIFMSGERKAYLIGTLALVTWFGPRDPRLIVMGLAAVPALMIAVSLDQSGYLKRQLESLGSNEVAQMSLSEIAVAENLPSLSNAQREFSNRYAMQLWKEQPIFGIGTDQFIKEIRRDRSVPQRFRYNVHGEFHRSLFENGIVGLSWYIMIWLGAAAAVLFNWKPAVWGGDPEINKIKVTMLATVLFYCAFEAAKTQTVIGMLMVPFITALPPRPSRQEEAVASGAEGHGLGRFANTRKLRIAHRI